MEFEQNNEPQDEIPSAQTKRDFPGWLLLVCQVVAALFTIVHNTPSATSALSVIKTIMLSWF